MLPAAAAVWLGVGDGVGDVVVRVALGEGDGDFVVALGDGDEVELGDVVVVV